MAKLLFLSLATMLQLQLQIFTALTDAMNLPTEKLNSVLDIFQTCQSDIIFVGEAEDIQTKHPVAVYSLLNYSVSFRTVDPSKYDEQGDGCELDSEFPTVNIRFRCINYNPFIVKTSTGFRFKCLSIIIFWS